jgi:hypothetical protein
MIRLTRIDEYRDRVMWVDVTALAGLEIEELPHGSAIQWPGHEVWMVLESASEIIAAREAEWVRIKSNNSAQKATPRRAAARG